MNKMQSDRDSEYYAAKKALEDHEAEKQAEAKKITAITVIGILGGMAFPILGVVAGLFHLANGRGEKAALYLVTSIGIWICAVAILL